MSDFNSNKKYIIRKAETILEEFDDEISKQEEKGNLYMMKIKNNRLKRKLVLLRICSISELVILILKFIRII